MTESDELAPDFTLNGLARLLEMFQRVGYSFVGFDQAPEPGSASLILRHDVDLDLQAAVDVARIECALGVRATYFFLTTSDLYNVASNSGRSALQEIVASGHAIGLHFDPSIYERKGVPTSPTTALLNERSMLSEAVGEPIGTFSLHKPSDDPAQFVGLPDDLVNAYAPAFFTDIGYVSDSMGWWRFGPPQEQSWFHRRVMAQVVVHPIWWASMVSEHPAARLERLIQSRGVTARGSLAETVSPFHAWLRNRTTDKWVWTDDIRGQP
ncbi:hypothetical protein BH10ACT2_BH10ACT2_00200 [soil metagenome]